MWNILLLSVASLLIHLMFFCRAKVFHFDEFSLQYFLLKIMIWWQAKNCLALSPKHFSPYFSKSFTGLHLILKTVIYFSSFLNAWSLSQGCFFVCFMSMNAQLFQCYLLKTVSILYWLFIPYLIFSSALFFSRKCCTF